MLADELRNRKFEDEFVFSASRSSGPGGQNVNKVNTKVELRFSVFATLILNEAEKEIVLQKLKKKINKEGELLIVSQEGRTQNENKIIVIEKFYDLITKALTIPAHRKPTKPTLSSKAKRLDEKKIRSKVKKLRRTDTDSDIF
ncbi:MAG TPA: alternative ribosome rescue aminoacyl-tRNA hydrolase ArfB [Bacteroidales bacterium]|nr:alternative ribosome rescue aminoacyl-tRNA hydrolase ArfB [Bacteroidales bacterium]